MEGDRFPSRRSLLAQLAGGGAALWTSWLLTGCSTDQQRQSTIPPVSVPPTMVPAGLPVPPATDDVIVATATGSTVAVLDAPGGNLLATVPSPMATGAAAVFLVEERHRGWAKASLPVPMPKSGWLPSDQISYSRHPYRIVVELARHRLVLFKGSDVVRVEAVGVGTVNSPTPPGTYYTTELLRPPDPDGFYGPFAYGLNGFNGAPADQEGLNGQMGLHGTNDPTTLGREVTLGCLRVSNGAIRALATMLPVGVPIFVQ